MLIYLSLTLASLAAASAQDERCARIYFPIEHVEKSCKWKHEQTGGLYVLL